MEVHHLPSFKVDEIHARTLAAGALEGLAPTTLGDVARISMILDPDGNWIELSQRASIVGTLTWRLAEEQVCLDGETTSPQQKAT